MSTNPLAVLVVGDVSIRSGVRYISFKCGNKPDGWLLSKSEVSLKELCWFRHHRWLPQWQHKNEAGTGGSM